MQKTKKFGLKMLGTFFNSWMYDYRINYLLNCRFVHECDRIDSESLTHTLSFPFIINLK